MPLVPPVSSLARQTIRTAYEDLERTITPSDWRDSRQKTLQDVRVAALEIEKQLAARQSLRNMRRLMPLFKGLEHYSKVINILCNGTPYLPWIWAPITLILRVASEYVEAFEQVIKGYSRIAASLARFEILSDAFTSDQDFQQTLAVFYADILQFHKHAYKFVRRSGWKLLFLTSWGRFQRRFDNILEDMKRHETLIDQEANARNIAEAQRMRQDIRTWREESLEQVGHLEEEQAARQYQSIMSWLKMDESDQLAIFDSISAEGARYPGTCGWTLKNPKVSSWLQRRPDTPILWLHGTPGSGKSVISTQLVNFIKAAKHFVIHHFCTYSYASSTMYDQILRSLLLQLLRKDGELVAHVYEECVLGKKSPTVSALEQLLQTLFASTSNEPCQTEYIWVILDGLDECEADKQARVISLMNQVTSKSTLSVGTICKVLISSRASPILSNRLRKKQMISLTDEKDCLEQAIRQYASQRLQSLHQKFCQLHVGPSEIEDIERRIAKKADGMFLYARLVLDYLATNIFYSGDEIKTSVNQLPEKLTDFYRKILTQILIHLDPRSVDRIKCILGWIAFAKRPLRKLEFLSAISFSSGDPEVAHLAPHYVLDICGPLIQERRDTSLAFIHVSVKDFLQTSSSSLVINEQEALKQHGIATITCLLSGLEVFSNTYEEQTKYLRVVKGLHGLHVYATEHWTEYLLSHAASTSGLDTNPSLLTLANRLADKLGEAVNPTTTKEVDSESRMLDERLISLRQHTALYKQVEGALKARSLKRLEAELLQEHVQDGNSRRSSNLPGLDGISTMLTSYQEAVMSLLSQSDYPGVSAEELELFKRQFRTSAFTCRLNSCPRATLGFESEHLRLEHEMAHMRRFWCISPGCKYPPFVSAQSLKNHLNKYHDLNPPRKSIRQVGHIAKIRSENAVGLTTQPLNSPIIRTSPGQMGNMNMMGGTSMPQSFNPNFAANPGMASAGLAGGLPQHVALPPNLAAQQALAQRQYQVTQAETHAFVSRVAAFMQQINLPLDPNPRIAGQPVNLLRLFQLVMSAQGSSRVTNSNQWPQLARDLAFPEHQYPQAGAELKVIFTRNLGPWERLLQYRPEGLKAELEAMIKQGQEGPMTWSQQVAPTKQVPQTPVSNQIQSESDQFLVEPPIPQPHIGYFYDRRSGSNTPKQRQQPPNVNANQSQADPIQQLQAPAAAAQSPPVASKSVLDDYWDRVSTDILDLRTPLELFPQPLPRHTSN